MRAAFLSFALVACVPATSPEAPARARARAAIVAGAEGLKAADAICATVAIDRKDVHLGEGCATAYAIGRASFIAAEDALDATGEGSASCKAASGFASLSSLANALQSSGLGIPAKAVDALALAADLARMLPCVRDGGAP